MLLYNKWNVILMTKASLIINDQNNVDLLLKPENNEELVTTQTIKELIRTSEFNSLSINNNNIKNALTELNNTLNILQNNQLGKEIRYQILERIDAQVTISIESDEMGASAEIKTAQGGKHLTAKAILSAAQQAGIKKGFSKQEIIKLAQLGAKESPNKLIALQIAQGKVAIPGKDATIKPLVESAQMRILKPKKRADGSVDMRELGDIICVNIGDPLAQKIPLTKGREGYTVTGTPLQPDPGNDIALTPGEGTIISEDNENILVSEKVGLPKLINNGMEVDEVYKIKNVTVATGNINFLGSVIIDGDVMEGMKVIASGDVTVGGFVESAIVKSGGDITIQGGIIGRKNDTENNNLSNVTMSISLSAKGSVYAKYAQYAQITCAKDVRIENQLLHSLLDVRGRLWIGKETKADGKLIGGYIKAGTRVQSGVIGATAGSNTYINFAHKVNTIKNAIQQVDEKLKIVSDKVQTLRNKINKLKKDANKNDKNVLSLLTKEINNYQYGVKEVNAFKRKKDTLDSKLQEYMSSVYIEATEKMHHGVELIIGDFNKRTNREYVPSKMIYRERKIFIDPVTKL